MQKTIRVFKCLALIIVLHLGKYAAAQTDPKLHPGESYRVTNLQITNRSKDASGDSTVTVQVTYVDKDGKPASLNFSDVRFHKTDSLQNARVKDEEGRWNNVTGADVKRILASMIQNPPDYIYYIDGKIAQKQSIKKLDIDRIVTVNIIHGDEAVEKYGEAARKGVVLLTTGTGEDHRQQEKVINCL